MARVEGAEAVSVASPAQTDATNAAAHQHVMRRAEHLQIVHKQTKTREIDHRALTIISRGIRRQGRLAEPVMNPFGIALRPVVPEGAPGIFPLKRLGAERVRQGIEISK